MLACSGTDTPAFQRPLLIRFPKGRDVDVRFALYDADQDDRLEEEELVGEAVVLARSLLEGQPLSLPLSKWGRPVLDAAIIVTPEGRADSAAPPSPPPVRRAVRLGVKGFPALAGDAMIDVALIDPISNQCVAVGRTERIR